jgi:hypothetical protein
MRSEGKWIIKEEIRDVAKYLIVHNSDIDLVFCSRSMGSYLSMAKK